MKYIKLLIAALCVIALAACAKKPSLVGTWETMGSQIIVTIKKNGDFGFNGPSGNPVEAKWSHVGDKLVLVNPNNKEQRREYHIMVLGDDKLTLRDFPEEGQTLAFDRVKGAQD